MADIKTDKYKNGMKVVFTADKHKYMPLFYPPAGTKGVIVEADGTDIPRIKWFGFKPFVAGDFRDSAFYHNTEWKVVETAHPPKILITVDKADPQKVIAKDLDSGKTGVAKCNPTDTFDFYTGAKLAFARLCGEDKPKEPQKRKFKVGDKVVGNKKASANYSITREGWRGTVFEVPPDEDFIWVRSENGDSHFYVRTSCFDLLTEPKGWNGKVVCVEPHSMYFTAGKVYTVKNGVMLKDNGSPANTTLLKSPDDLRDTHIFTSKFIEYKGEA